MLNKICNQLTKTYNTNYLNYVDKKIQGMFLYESERNKNNKGNTVLMNLIYNHYKKKKPIATFIGGPITLSLHWSNKYKKMIYIFGEKHSSTIDCDKIPDYNNEQIPVELFLENLVKNTDVFLDIFIESPIFEKGEYKNLILLHSDLRLDKVFNKFRLCIQSLTRVQENIKEQCRLSRIHYFDIRRKDDRVGVNDVSWLRKKIHIIMVLNNDNYYKNLLKNERVRKILYKLSSNEEEFKQFWIEQLDNLYVKKEIHRSYLGKEIYNFIKKKRL